MRGYQFYRDKTGFRLNRFSILLALITPNYGLGLDKGSDF